MPTIRQVETVPSVIALPGPQSNVEITTSARGEVQLNVKVYHEDVSVALHTALAVYEQGLIALESVKQRVDQRKEHHKG